MEEAGRILLDVVLLLLGAKLGGEAAERLRQPPVLGELLVGVLLGAAGRLGWLPLPDLAHPDADAATLLFLAQLGAILLLFQVGLESDLPGLRQVGASSLWVAAIGMAASFAVGYAASWGRAQAWGPWQAAQASLPPTLLHAFVGATLTATSVGITARVLGDMRRITSPEARIILGAAVLDDVGGLLVLAIVSGMVAVAAQGTALDVAQIGTVAAVAIGFLVVSLAAGLWLVPRVFDAIATRAKSAGMSLSLAVGFALAMAYGAAKAGLATIVGAFAAGLVLAPSKGATHLRHQVESVAALFVGLFFVTLGMRVDLTALEGHGAAVVAIGLGLSALAVAAKLACGLGVVRRQANRLVVGVGMVPRGEVGLIFAAFGLGTAQVPGLLAPWQYTTLILVVLVTTFITPLWLRRLADSFTGPPDAARSNRLDVGEMP